MDSHILNKRRHANHSRMQAGGGRSGVVLGTVYLNASRGTISDTPQKTNLAHPRRKTCLSRGECEHEWALAEPAENKCIPANECGPGQSLTPAKHGKRNVLTSDALEDTKYSRSPDPPLNSQFSLAQRKRDLRARTQWVRTAGGATSLVITITWIGKPISQTTQRFGFNLSNAFSCKPQLCPNFLKGFRFFTPEPKP